MSKLKIAIVSKPLRRITKQMTRNGYQLFKMYSKMQTVQRVPTIQEVPYIQGIPTMQRVPTIQR